MEFKQYPSYKKSGVEWLGGVPEHWVGSKFKYIFQEKQHTKNMNLPFGAISFGSVVYKEDKANLTDELKENYQEVLQGEFLVNPLNLNYDLKSLRTALSKIDVVVSSGYFVLKLKNNTFNKRYLEYLLYIFDIRKMKTLGAGIRQTLTFRDMAVCDVAIPSACEQTQIASFLDYETFRIDNLIAKQEKLIELLEEQRKSIISHAVTKGLNSNAPMKDSGVEWLGEVPSNWDVVKLRWITQDIKTGGTPSIYVPTDDYNTDYIDWFTPSDFNGSFHLKNAQKKVNPQAIIDRDLKIIPENSILLIGIGATLGKVGYITVKASSNQQINYLSLNRKKTELIFLVYYFFAHNQYIKNMASASTLPILNQQKMGDIFVSLPNVSDQQKIINFLDSENLKFDNLISKQKSLIEKLKEYRTSIISHAVTGKIDVREFGA